MTSILKESHYTPGAFLDALGAPSLAAVLGQVHPRALFWLRTLMKARAFFLIPKLNGRLGKGSWEIQSYTFTYRSQTVDGREIEMSGRVTFPGFKTKGKPHQVRTISLHSHQAFLSPEWAPSQNLMFMPFKVLWDSAVIEPDLQKWGVNFAKENDGGGSAVHMARQLADCTVAGLEIMQQHGVTLAPEGYTINWGSSQGAVPALMFAKWYDTEAPQEFKDTMRLKYTFSGEGAADMSAFMEYNYRHTELIDPDFIVLVAYFKAFTPEQLGGYKPQEFVPQWYLEPKIPVNGRDYSLMDVASYFTPAETGPYSRTMTSYDQVVAPDMLTARGEVDMDSPKVRAWLSCLKKHNNLDSWTPAHSVYVAHSPQDDMIPYEIAYNVYSTISGQGKNADVHMMSVPFPRFIPTGGLNAHLVTAFLMQVYMSLVQHPKDMFRLFKSVR